MNDPVLRNLLRAMALMGVCALALVVFIAAIAVYGAIAEAIPPASPLVPTATASPTPVPKYKVLAGNTSDRISNNFVVVDKSLNSDREELREIAHGLCVDQMICLVLFWDDESKAATRIPMTDNQVNAQVAVYNLNINTGLDKLLICESGSCNE